MKHNIIRVSLLGLLVGLMVALVACNEATPTTQPRTIFSPVKPATINAGDAIPLPTENTILTISGNINNHNQGETIVMDMPTLESVGLVEYTVMDPFKDEKISYQGVPMDDLLALWQIDDKSTTLVTTALNDYQIEIPLSLFDEIPVLMALKSNGEYMPVSDRGPTMLVFPYDDYELDSEIYNKYWIWQLKSVEVQ